MPSKTVKDHDGRTVQFDEYPEGAIPGTPEFGEQAKRRLERIRGTKPGVVRQHKEDINSILKKI